MRTISPRQKDCLNSIKSLIKKNGYCPSVRQICEAMGDISTNAVFNHLLALEKKGYIRRPAGTARAIVIL